MGGWVDTWMIGFEGNAAGTLSLCLGLSLPNPGNTRLTSLLGTMTCQGAMDETGKALNHSFLRCVSNLKGAGSQRSLEKAEKSGWTMAILEM